AWPLIGDPTRRRIGRARKSHAKTKEETMASPPNPTSLPDRDSAPLPPLLAGLRDAVARPEGRLQLASAFVSLVLLGLVFRSNWRHLVHVWMTDENYSHGFLVPLIGLYFANEAARKGPVPVRSGVGWGLALLLLAIGGCLTATLVPIGVVAHGAFLVGLTGLFTLLLGTAALRRYAFPL